MAKKNLVHGSKTPKKKSPTKKETKNIGAILERLKSLKEDNDDLLENQHDLSNRLETLEETMEMERQQDDQDEQVMEWQIKEASKKRKGDITYYVYCIATDEEETDVAFLVEGLGEAETLRFILNNLDRPCPDLLTDMSTKGQKL